VNLIKNKKIAPFALYVGVKRIYILIEIFFEVVTSQVSPTTHKTLVLVKEGR
jgi:hypothetical protein